MSGTCVMLGCPSSLSTEKSTQEQLTTEHACQAAVNGVRERKGGPGDYMRKQDSHILLVNT